MINTLPLNEVKKYLKQCYKVRGCVLIIFCGLWDRLSGVGVLGCCETWVSPAVSDQVICVSSSLSFGGVVSVRLDDGRVVEVESASKKVIDLEGV